MDGKNVADFIDIDIAAKLDALEAEEAKLIAEGYYDSISEDEVEEPIRQARPAMSAESRARMESRMPRKRARSVSRGESIARTASTLSKRVKTLAHGTSQTRDRSLAGLSGEGQLDIVKNIKALGERQRNLLAKAGEADRSIKTKMPKHLFSGKRGFAANHR